jgi:hypothetical protein
VISSRTVVVSDPLARANVLAALAGPGGPAGVLTCAQDGAALTLTFDDERTAAELIDALVAVETAFVPARAAAFDDVCGAVGMAARGLDEPELDAARLIETYLP